MASATISEGEVVLGVISNGASQAREVPEALTSEVVRWARTTCQVCQQSAMFYCPYCCTPLGVPEGVSIPEVRLPFFRCDVLFDDGPKKATGVHAKVLAPGQVRLIDLFTNDASRNRTLSRKGASAAVASEQQLPDAAYPEMAVVREIPEYDPEATLVLFPDESSVPLGEASLPTSSSTTLVIIDAPWRRAQALRRDPRLAHLRSVRLRSPPQSRFWRYHAEGAGCVSTIEALAASIREVKNSSDNATGSSTSSAQNCAGKELEEPILFFFARQFAQIVLRSGKGCSELPMDEAAKERRSARVRQKDRAKRLRPLGGGEECLAEDSCRDSDLGASPTVAEVKAARTQ